MTLPTDLTRDQPGMGLRILVAEPNSFFAQDMLACLHEVAPGARVSTFPGLTDVLHKMAEDDAAGVGSAGLHEGRAQLLVIVSARLVDIQASGLEQTLTAAGGRILVMQGLDPDEALHGAGLTIAPTPFTAQTMASALRAVGVVTPPTVAEGD